MVKRRETRAFRHVLETKGNIVTSQSDVLNAFVTHFRQKYQTITLDQTCVIAVQGVNLISAERNMSTRFTNPLLPTNTFLL